MIKVAGAWELGWNTPLFEYDLWAFPLRAYDVDDWYMAPVSGIDKRQVTEIADTLNSIELNPDLTPVFIDENGVVPLGSFQHPRDALYLLGKAGYSPWRANAKKGISVRIENPHPGGLMWPHQCIATVLHDRMLKP